MPAYRIALIHAVHGSIGPVETAFRHTWPEAERMNLLDDSLSVDRERAGALTPDFFTRFRTLGDYALAAGADGILFTCSAFGPALDAVAAALAIPVLKPNEAMFADALACGRRIGMLATFEPSVASMEAEFRQMTQATGSVATIETLNIPAAREALNRGDVAGHDALLAAAAPRLGHCDCVMLAHFSTATALPAVAAAIGTPVLAAPASAVRALKARLLSGPSAGGPGQR